MKKLFSLLISAGLLAAPLALISTPAAAKTHNQVSGQTQGASVQAKAKHKGKKAKAKKAKSAARKK